jgi:alpha-tubulin suppressor-like RCC1 family protein
VGITPRVSLALALSITIFMTLVSFPGKILIGKIESLSN